LKSSAIPLFFLVLLLPMALEAQEELPDRLVAVETARSRACVESLARLAELDASLEPYFLRLERLNALGVAMALESREEAAPFDRTDPLEDAVVRWFSADSALAVRYLADPQDALREERREARNLLLDRIRATMVEVSSELDEKARAGADIELAAQPCFGAVMVRSVVLEACANTTSPVCDAARATERQEQFRFVEEPEEIWNIEEYGPWSPPGPLRMSQDGEMAGARTSARARLGNVVFHFSLAPLILARQELDEEEIAMYQANLDSLGFTFDHPLLVMAPAFEIRASMPPPLGGETHYIIHFGDLSGDDIIWSAEAGSGGLFQALMPASDTDLTRLSAGEQVSLTAIRVPEGEEEVEADLVYTLPILQLNQETNVGILLAYLREGGLNDDLKTLIPPEGL